ncbi:hypothetical protein [Cohnella fermenti]|uniref:Uncharacterized protein n=1 Tax=Cohnella fermenti TaxID=2565925 RepID=A0A4S4C943_9BACL|nr:hypothetical protein [Cohnella fermenti]THF84569.1 hypothetical protein E6C55_00880 [Cohnella fermenti]
MMTEWPREAAEACLAEFRKSARQSADAASFFVLYKLYLSKLKETPCLDRFLVAAEAAIRENVRCPHCRGEYAFRYWTSLAGDELEHTIELICRPCGDFLTLAESRDAVASFNSRVVRRVYHLERRGAELLIEAGYGDLPAKASLMWDAARKAPKLWINLNRVRDADEVSLFWNRARKELRRRRQLAERLR